MNWAIKRTQSNKAMSADNVIQNLFKNKQILKRWESSAMEGILKNEYYEQKLLNNLTLDNFKISESMNIKNNSFINLRNNNIYSKDNMIHMINLNMFRYKTRYHIDLVRIMKKSKLKTLPMGEYTKKIIKE